MNRTDFHWRDTLSLLKESAIQWYNRDPFLSSSAISYYTIFSLPGLFVIIINLAGFFYGTEAITNQLSAQVGEMVGEEAAGTVEKIVANTYTASGITWSSIISLLVLIFGATGVFYQIQNSLNHVWGVQPRPDQALLKFLTDRLFSFGMILIIGFLLMVSLVISSLVTALTNLISVDLFGLMEVILRITDFLISLGIITVLFAALYKILPDAEIRWKDVWVGALVTAILFVIAKFLLGLYFSYSNPASIYGAAGSIILIMLWTTYSALILLYGAEFTQIYARRYGKRIEPSEHAEFSEQSKEGLTGENA